MNSSQSLALPIVRWAKKMSRSHDGIFPASDIPRILDRSANVAFLATASKVPLGALFALSLGFGNVRTAAVLMAGIILLDIGDGIIFSRSTAARHRGLSRARRFLDAVSDRVLVGLAIQAGLISGLLPVSVATALIGREAVALVVVGLPFARDGQILRPNLQSRAAMAYGGMLGIAAILGAPISIGVLIPYIAAATWGLALYVYRPAVL